MQDEPGGRGCFAYKMSLKRGSVMLGIDDQSEQQTGDEPGRDPGFFESQRGSAFRRRGKGACGDAVVSTGAGAITSDHRGPAFRFSTTGATAHAFAGSSAINRLAASAR